MTSVSDISLVNSLLNIQSYSPINKIKATQLIDRYQSIETILFAPMEELTTTYDLLPQQLQLLRLLRTILLRTQERKLHTFNSVDSTPYLDYIKLHIAHQRIEGLFVILLSSHKKYIHSELINKGSETSVTLPVNHLIKLALNHNARYLILAHNHPNSSIRPTPQDISITAELSTTLLRLNIRLIDHVIVTPTLVFSILSKRLIVHLSNQDPLE